MEKTLLHYEIREKIGEGGMGVVYRGQDTRLGRPVAIKFLPREAGLEEKDRKRFRTEARAAAALNHPNIATIHAIEEADTETFIVMEFVEGRELKKIIQDETLSLDRVLGIVEAISEGLGTAHSKGITHRDIKSSNIMVTSEGTVKVMDFGLAKIRGDAEATATGTTLGTAAYMSPEQAKGLPVDQRTDIWSLGVVLYEMLTGELPFRTDHGTALYGILHEDPLEPSKLDRKIPPDLDAIVMKTLEKDRDRRYATVSDFLKDLRDFRKGWKDREQGQKAKVIAVLPFQNISPEKDSEYFGDGLTEELIMNLSRLKDMKVVSRTTSMQYKGTNKNIRTIGRELDARFILEGSVRKFQDNLRITAQLIDVNTDTQLWAETFKGNLADVFDIQEKVSKQIVDALMLKLSPSEKVVLTKRSTVNPEAFDCNLRARDFLYQMTKNKLKIAIQLFERAIELDPRYANAYAGLGEAYATLYQQFERQENWLEKSIEASLKALMYDSSLAQAYAALGLCYFNKKLLDEALEASQKSIKLDPTDYIAYWILGRIYHTTDNEEQAIEQYKKVIELNPDFYSAYSDLRMAYERLGDQESSDRLLHESLEMYPAYLLRHPDDGRAYMFYAIHLAEAGEKEPAKKEAARALELDPADPLMLYNAACFYARLGDKKMAIDSLERAVKAGHENYEWFKRDPDLEPIRDEPQYIELMKGK